MSFNALSRIIWARKLTFFTVFALITAASVAFCLLVTPIFQSKAVVMISPPPTQEQRQAPLPDMLRYQINSQVYVIESEDVIRPAIAGIGPKTLFPDLGQSSLHGKATLLFPWMEQLVPASFGILLPEVASLLRPDAASSDLDQALIMVRKRLGVTAEKDSQVLSITFRHEDPDLAEQFLQRIVAGFLRRQADLTGNAVAPAFFRQQAEHYRGDYKRASTALNEFAKEHGTYSIRQEIELALERRDEATSALAKTQGSIAEKQAQATTLQNTLAQLRRRTSLPQELTGPQKPAVGHGDRNLPNESPLLLAGTTAKLFEQTAQSLVDVTSNIAGLRGLEKAQEESLTEVEKRLGELSSIQAEFGRLKNEVDQAAKILEAHVGRAAEAQMNADWDASAKLSSVKVVEAPTRPVRPVFPPKPLLITLGMAIGLVGGAAASAAIESIAARRRRLRAVREDREDFLNGRVRNIRRQDWWAPEHEVVEYRVR